MANKLIGQNFEPHDVVAKVTGRAKYAEDFRAEGMVFCKLLTSPMPHARIRHIDASDALAEAFDRRAILLATPVGTMQASRVGLAMGNQKMLVFNDEGAAVTYVTYP